MTEAVQVEPLDGLGWAHAGPGLRPATVGGQPARVNGGHTRAVTHRIVVALPAAGVLATISFGENAGLARRILAGLASSSPAAPSTAGPLPQPSSPGPAATAGPVLYAGKGFDTCGAPSESSMSAWLGTSPYRAVGIYIGGVNRACPDGNLSAAWVQDELAAGWSLIPLYVGPQAPCSAGMAAIDPAQATAQGTQAADDAVSRARFFGIGAGNPLYYDMEAWNTSDQTCSTAVVEFIKAWTTELSAQGYRSGIYSSAYPLGQDIAPFYGETDAPSLVDFAQWDGAADTSTTRLPDTAWPDHQRIKQYDGDITETWGGVPVNIDRDYSDAMIVGDTQPAVTGVNPTSAAVGTAVTITGRSFVPGNTTVQFGGVASGRVSVTSGNQLVAYVPARSIAAVDITVTTPAGTSAVTDVGRFTYRPLVAAAVDPRTRGYWLTTPQGNVYNFHAPFYGSTATKSLPAPVVGIGADPKTGGYWLTTAKGNVYNFHAPFYGSTATKSLPAPVVGIAADPLTGGYWLVTSKGNVYNFNAPWYGSTAGSRLPAPVVGIAADPRTGGYWLTTAKGNVYNFHAPFYGSTATRTLPAPVVAVTGDPDTGGYWLTTAKGNVYNYHAPFYGSTATRNLPAPVTSLVGSGPGYLVTTSAGNVFNFDANWYGSPASRG